MLRQHRRYLRGRGFKPSQLANDWGLLGTGHMSGIWNWRVIVPIHNEAGAVVAYQGRAITSTAEPKYRMTPDDDALEDPKSILYGVHLAERSVIVVEGVTGVWRIGPGAVATLGIDWSREQADRLRQFERRFILFDPEPQAQQRAEELANWVSYFPGETELISGFDTDPGEYTTEQVTNIRQDLGVDNPYQKER